MSDNNDPAPDNGNEEQEDHSLAKKLLSAMIGLLGTSYVDGPLTGLQKAMVKHGPWESCSPGNNFCRSLARTHWSVKIGQRCCFLDKNAPHTASLKASQTSQ